MLKKFFRAVVFYTVAIYLVSQIVPGFQVATNWRSLLLTGATLALFFSLVRPIIKTLLFPLNVLTLGLFSFVSEILTFYLYWYFFPDFIQIQAWSFSGWSYAPLGLSLPAMPMTPFLTIVISTFIISFLVSLFSSFL